MLGVGRREAAGCGHCWQQADWKLDGLCDRLVSTFGSSLVGPELEEGL